MGDTDMAQTTASRRKALEGLEKKIEEAEGSFMLIGEALQQVQESKLYEVAGKSVDTFEAWAQERFDMSRTHAYRLIGAAAIAKVAREVGYRLNERQARELKGLENEPDLVSSILDKAKSDAPGGKLTARQIDITRKILAGGVEPSTPEAEASANAPDLAADNDSFSSENWSEVIKETARRLRSQLSDMPAHAAGDYAAALDKIAVTARRKAKKAA